MHAVDIGIGGNNNLVIAQSIESIFYVESSLQQVEFFIFINNLLCQPEGVERFAAQREDSLCIHVTALCDTSAGRVALGNEYGAFLLTLVLDITEMNAAVAKFPVVQVSLLGTFACQLCHASHGLSLSFAFLYLLFDNVGTVVFMYMQVVVYFTLQEVAHILVNRFSTWSHLCAAKFYLCLAFKDRFLNIDGYGCHYAVPDVGIFIAFVEELLYGLSDMLLECALMRSTLRGMLSIDKRVVFFAILVGMCKGYLDVFSYNMNYRIQAIVGHIVVQQVFKSVAALYPSSVIHYGKSGIEIRIVSQHRFHNLSMEAVILEESVVGFEEYVCTVLVGCFFSCICYQVSFLECEMTYLPVTERFYLKTRAQRINSLDTDTIQSDTFLESL